MQFAVHVYEMLLKHLKQKRYEISVNTIKSFAQKKLSGKKKNEGEKTKIKFPFAMNGEKQ